MIEALDRQLAPLEHELRQLARRQTGCRALMAHYGIGELTAPTILCELGDVHPPVGLAQGGALRRPRHRRAPLRPPLAGRPGVSDLLCVRWGGWWSVCEMGDVGEDRSSGRGSPGTVVGVVPGSARPW